jgi:hypothetical protein
LACCSCGGLPHATAPRLTNGSATGIPTAYDGQFPRNNTYRKTSLGHDRERIPARFAHLAANGVGSARVAGLSAQTWRNIEAALSPIIGVGGVRALYRRSIHLSRNEHPWLAAELGADSQPGDYSALAAVLLQRSPDAAAEASDALLQIFHDLLGTLIGNSLTERLLGPVWELPLNSQDPEDGIR